MPSFVHSDRTAATRTCFANGVSGVRRTTQYVKTKCVRGDATRRRLLGGTGPARPNALSGRGEAGFSRDATMVLRTTDSSCAGRPSNGDGRRCWKFQASQSLRFQRRRPSESHLQWHFSSAVATSYICVLVAFQLLNVSISYFYFRFTSQHLPMS